MSRVASHHHRTRGLILGVVIGGAVMGLLIVAMSPSTAGHEGGNLSAICWLLVVGGITGTVITARGIGWGWLLLVALQPLWVGYAVATEQHGFVVSALVLGIAQLQGYLRSRSSAPCR